MNDESADARFDDRYDDLLSGLARFLAADSGLREVRNLADQGDLVRGLGGGLDVEGGLAAVLGPRAGVAPGAAVSSGEGTGRGQTAAAVRAVDAGRRLAARKEPVVVGCVVSELLVRAVDIGLEILDVGGPDWDFSRARDRVRGLAGALGLACARDRALALGLVRDLDRALGGALDLVLVLDRALDRDLGGDRARVLGVFVRDRARARARARDLVRALGGALGGDLVRDLALDRDLARDLVLGGDLDRDRDLALVRDLALDLASTFARAAGVKLNLDNVEGLATALLDGALDDFTHADLTNVDLADVDLSGIQWSESTRWPPGTDIEAMRRRSQETSPNSGVYAVEPPSGGTDRDLSDVRL